VRALFPAFASLSLLAASAVAQNPAIDVSTFIKSSTQTGTLVQDPEAPISFQLTPDWQLTEGARWGDHETTLAFVENESQLRVSLYYQYPLQERPSADPYQTLQQAMLAKVRERVERENIAEYHILPTSVQKRQVGGQPALSFIAEFTSQGQTRVEYMVRILGKNTKAHFFVMGIPATADIDAVCKRLEPIVTSLRIP
jgi:hypothetical protein